MRLIALGKKRLLCENYMMRRGHIGSKLKPQAKCRAKRYIMNI